MPGKGGMFPAPSRRERESQRDSQSWMSLGKVGMIPGKQQGKGRRGISWQGLIGLIQERPRAEGQSSGMLTQTLSDDLWMLFLVCPSTA